MLTDWQAQCNMDINQSRFKQILLGQQVRKQFRSLVIGSMVLTLGLSTLACGPVLVEDSSNVPAETTQTQQPAEPEAQTQLSDGQYGVQQVTYDDATGEYAVQLLNTKPGEPSLFRTDNLPMARLTDEEVASKKGNYLAVEQGQPALHIAEDFRIEYVHNVTETATNPDTGQPETIVVRQESSFWTPFAGALAGQALGSLLFTPHYYIPPVYQPGIILTGYGGYGRTYTQAVDRYQTRYKAPPAEVQNRQTLRTSGQVRRRSNTSTSGQSSGQTGTNTRRRTQQTDRPSGSGYGSDTLRRNNNNSDRSYRRNNGGGFGSNRARRSGSRRRR